jgi:hypothetical protein
MILSTNIILYKGYDIKRIEGKTIRNSLKYTRKADLFSRRGVSPFVKFVEYSSNIDGHTYTSKKLKDVKD